MTEGKPRKSVARGKARAGSATAKVARSPNERTPRIVDREAVGTVVVLSSSEGEIAKISDGPLLQRLAMQFSFVVRNRSRWNTNAARRREESERCEDAARKMGLGDAELRCIAESRILEIRVPYSSEDQGWAARVMPWEYLLSGATESLRSATGSSGDSRMVIVRHLSRNGETQPPKDGRSVAVVISAPGKIGKIYDFKAEWEIPEISLAPVKQLVHIPTPTLKQLSERISASDPGVIHVGGVDTHQGAELLEWDGIARSSDGMLLAGPDAKPEPVAVSAKELAAALTSGSKKPALIVFNLYHSAARIAPLSVAGGAGVALGFQDTFDDQAAELFLADFYRAWAETGDALVSFRTGWEALERFPKPLRGSGIVLWSAQSLLRSNDDVSEAARNQHEAIVQNQQQWLIESETEASNALTVECVSVESLNYSLLHNRQPLFREFVLKPNRRISSASIEKVKVEVKLATEPTPAVWEETVSVGRGGLDLRAEVHLPLTSQLIRTLEESLKTNLSVKVSVGGFEAYHQTFSVTLLAISEWVDDDQNRKFLPSFVRPDDEDVRRVIAAAQPYLCALTDNPTAGFDGYQSVDSSAGDPSEGVDLQVAAIWRALLDLNLAYINPPPSYSKSSQRLRTPRRVIDGGRGTCIDLALLLAACLEYVEIYPVIFLLDQHAFPGYWRSEEGWTRFVELRGGAQAESAAGSRPTQPAVDLGDVAWMFPSGTRASDRRSACKMVRAAIESEDLVALESVWLTSRASFREAMDDGWDNLSNVSEFNSLIDVRSARGAEPAVTPLPLGGSL